MSGTNWLDLSLSSNRHIRTYVQGFVDISGGDLIVRNNNLFVQGGDSSLNGRLLIGGDSSFNGNVVIGSTLYPRGGINLQNNLTMGGLINQSGTNVQGGIIYQPLLSSDVSAVIYASNIYLNNMGQSGSNFIIGNANTSVVIGVSGNPLTVSGPLNALYDASFSGNVFVGKDITTSNGNLTLNNGKINILNGSLTLSNGNLFLNTGGIISTTSLNATSVNSTTGVFYDSLKVTGDASLNNRLWVASDASFGASVNVTRDLNVAGSLNVKQYTTNLMVYTVSYEFIVASDMSLNGRLFLYDDASMNKKLFVGGDVSMGGKLFTKGDASLNGILTVGGAVNMSDPTVSTTTTTGALKVSGGVGIVGNLNVGGNVSLGTASNTVSIPGKLINSGAVHLSYTEQNPATDVTYYNGTGSQITSGTGEIYLKFNSVKDNINWGTPVYTNGARLNIPYTGIYFIQFSFASTLVNKEMFIAKNIGSGSGIGNTSGNTIAYASWGSPGCASLSGSAYLLAGEYINIGVYNISSGTFTGWGGRSAFSITMIARTA